MGLLYALSTVLLIEGVAIAQQQIELSPNNVVEIITQASLNQDFSTLEALCGEGSSEVAIGLCTISDLDDNEIVDTMLEDFAFMMQIDEAVIDDTVARVNVVGTSPDGVEEERIESPFDERK